jgi:hypothetical protein
MAAERRVRKLLGQIMLERDLITPRQLSDALRAQKRTRGRLGRILVELGYVSELDMFRVVSGQDGLPFPSRFLPYFHRERGEPEPQDAFVLRRRRVIA